jgi:hypothetical protein
MKLTKSNLNVPNDFEEFKTLFETRVGKIRKFTNLVVIDGKIISIESSDVDILNFIKSKGLTPD